MKELKDSKKTKTKNSDDYLNQLLSGIDTEKLPSHLLLSQILRLVIELNDRIEQVDEKLKLLSPLTDVKRQIEEIHKLHFATNHLQNDRSLQDKYLAEILIGKVKKRK